MSVDPANAADAGVLDELLNLLDVKATLFEQIELEDGARIHLPQRSHVSFHYALSGTGELRVAAHKPFPVDAGFLVVAPAGMAVTATASLGLEVQHQASLSAHPHDLAAIEPLVILTVCVQTCLGALSDPFDSLLQPISLKVDHAQVASYQLLRAFNAWRAPRVGTRALIGAVLKQLTVEVFGDAYRAGEPWIRHLRIMKDPPIARAYALMLARPGASHSVSTLAKSANLGRSAFTERFSQALGCSPMLALRQTRMQRAASLLAIPGMSMEQVARSLGYRSTSSFARAFHSVVGKERGDEQSPLHQEGESEEPRSRV